MTAAIALLSVNADIRKMNAVVNSANIPPAANILGTVTHSSEIHSTALGTAKSEPSHSVSCGNRVTPSIITKNASHFDAR